MNFLLFPLELLVDLSQLILDGKETEILPVNILRYRFESYELIEMSSSLDLAMIFGG